MTSSQRLVWIRLAGLLQWSGSGLCQAQRLELSLSWTRHGDATRWLQRCLGD